MFTLKYDACSVSEHLRAIVARPQLVSGLQKLALGDSTTGHGSSLSDAAVQSLINAAPHLRDLSLEGCTRLSDVTLLYALNNCFHLERLVITGNDHVRGRITSKCIKDLAARPDVGPSLKELVLYNQGFVLDTMEQEAKALSVARKGLAVMTGETLGYAWNDSFAHAPLLNVASFVQRWFHEQWLANYDLLCGENRKP